MAAAVALATDMLPLADGSDMGGSLRNQQAFVTWWACARRLVARHLAVDMPGMVALVTTGLWQKL